MGGLRPGADTALKKAEFPIRGTALGRGDALHIVGSTGKATEKHTWQLEQVLQ